MRPLRALLLAALLYGCTPPAPREPALTERTQAGSRAAAPADTAARDDTAAHLELRVLDVGQGDAVLIRSDGRTALIDAGPADRIVAQLRALGVDTVDLLVASHNHADHIGGMDAVLDSFPVRFYLDNGHPAGTRIQQRVLERVERHGVTYLQPTRRTLSLGDAQLRVLPSPLEPRTEDQNNRSLTLVLEYRGFRALLPGDAETPLLNALLAAGDVAAVDVLKAAHHGSRNGLTPAWLARTRPAVVAISLGAGNMYGHPHEAALRYYCAGGRRVLRTDLHGDIIVRVDPTGGFTVQTGREATGADGSEPDACTTYSATEAAGVAGTVPAPASP